MAFCNLTDLRILFNPQHKSQNHEVFRNTVVPKYRKSNWNKAQQYVFH